MRSTSCLPVQSIQLLFMAEMKKFSTLSESTTLDNNYKYIQNIVETKNYLKKERNVKTTRLLGSYVLYFHFNKKIFDKYSKYCLDQNISLLKRKDF